MLTLNYFSGTRLRDLWSKKAGATGTQGKPRRRDPNPTAACARQVALIADYISAK